MERYIILSTISPDALGEPKDLKQLAETVKVHIRKNCPDATWVESYAVRGQYDLIDIVDVPSHSDINKVAMILRSFGYETTETMQATKWEAFLNLVDEIETVT